MENEDRTPSSGAHEKHRTTRHIYRTDIGPVCMSEEEHDAYLDAKEELELDDDNDENSQDRL